MSIRVVNMSLLITFGWKNVFNFENFIVLSKDWFSIQVKVSFYC